MGYASSRLHFRDELRIREQTQRECDRDSVGPEICVRRRKAVAHQHEERDKPEGESHKTVDKVPIFEIRNMNGCWRDWACRCRKCRCGAWASRLCRGERVIACCLCVLRGR